ncbi:MAG TPA: pseudouridine-5'-phosphate glycosidase [Clostridia bacterium]|nr:pseudouridine-5'-phosphate glycosidase [Clostridia bacterium]
MLECGRNLNDIMEIKNEVKDALETGMPVVALESTIIAHGMPYPENVETALAVEDIIRKAGVVPATIAIVGGVLKIGLSEQEIEYLATAKNVMKVSRRDFPYVMAMGGDGATTVSGTMIAAELAGIRVFVTGGVGGVHRNAEKSFDISADLTELSRTGVAVVSAGVKSILDIGLTLEYLETEGVPVVTFGTADFPAFYSRKSGFKGSCSVSEFKEAAGIMKAKWDLGLSGGMIIACPVPGKFEIPLEDMEGTIDKALKEAEVAGIRGKDLTPYLLSKIKDLTGGKSLETNRHLVFENARIGAGIASAYAEIERK